MIVRNEAHIVTEVLDAVAPYISSWVIVDTGSDDGTQDTIRNHMADLGVPGDLHERQWRNFGENRSEALQLAQGHSDYIWVMDADDTVRGQPDFARLSADVYAMRINDGLLYWRRQLFRDGMPWRYVGVVHEYADCDEPFREERLEGDYFIESRRLGARNNDPKKYERDRDLLLTEVQRDPTDARSAFYLAESYFNLGDFANARHWSARRAEMGGWDEETFYALCQVARSMHRLGEPWPAVLDAYLRAWEFRPTRAEPLHAIAAEYRARGEYHLGHLFAQRAAAIPLPEEDILFVDASVYQWRAADEQSVCASWIGRHEESFTLCRELLARSDIGDDDRRRIAKNRDQSVPALVEAAASYPESLVHNAATHRRDAEVTVSLIAAADIRVTAQTLNTFMNCCLDRELVHRYLILDTGIARADRAALLGRYPFLEFVTFTPSREPLAELTQLRNQITGRYWLHLDQGWLFFAPENYVGRLRAVLDAEPTAAQVGVNFLDAQSISGVCAHTDAIRRIGDENRYVLTSDAAHGPAMIDLSRLDSAPGDGPRTAALDEVFCIKGG
ncbi:glycosyltransferase [Mycolicibacterium mucogenicum]|uniref:tetratricopeptide repeat-containing glycosyltransferase n=1 Tax=Mycolicibacterium mucogenicum TaxID=56689 RepID=UPI0022699EFC|nr:glycosyltransferase [Mycolicibacterium mucogenicum]MCX8563174.1 glycosyltransferase [Mycolicibacterium mucogenicum]